MNKKTTTNIVKDLGVGAGIIAAMSFGFVGLAWGLYYLAQISWGIFAVVGFVLASYFLGKDIRDQRAFRAEEEEEARRRRLDYEGRVAADPCDSYPEGCPCTGGFRH